MNTGQVTIRHVDNEREVLALYPLMVQLRPQLATAEESVQRWQRQMEQHYRLLALYRNGQPRALAGYRITENLVHDRFLYLDDLITDAEARDMANG